MSRLSIMTTLAAILCLLGQSLCGQLKNKPVFQLQLETVGKIANALARQFIS